MISSKYHEMNMRCPVHLSIGQEAIAVGISTLLSKKDQVVSNHRSTRIIYLKVEILKNDSRNLWQK